MPSAWLALKLGQVLGARVEELFQLDEQPQERAEPVSAGPTEPKMPPPAAQAYDDMSDLPPPLKAPGPR